MDSKMDGKEASSEVNNGLRLSIDAREAQDLTLMRSRMDFYEFQSLASIIYTTPPQFSPVEGSYQSNPPFVPCIIDRMAEHILQLMHAAHAADKALSFTVFLPGWLESEV